MIANQQGTTVWKWEQQEPFGATPPNDNPSGLGSFDFPLRFPGQYFDRETNLAYNYFREYDSTIGRYVRSDPVGIRAGLNTYAYAGGNPLMLVDPRGLMNVVHKTSITDVLRELAKPCEYAENLRELLNVLERQSYENYQADLRELDRLRQINEDACRRIFASNPCFNFAQCLQETNKAYNDQLRARNEIYDEYRRQLADPDVLVRLLNAVASICDPNTVYGPPSSREIQRE
jgi:RHS repeat-associated protein